MPKIALTQSFVQDLIYQVAPLVTQATGWDLDLPTLRSRVLPKDQGYEEILLGRLQHLGIQGWEDLMPNILERLTETLIEENILAVYMPGTGEILVLRENVDDSNVNGIKLILAHELVHRGQHRMHASLFSKLDQLLRQAFMIMKSETNDVSQMRPIFEQIQPIMTLLESHATYVQSLLAQSYFQDARVETHFNIATLIMRLVGAPKLAQYSDGLPEVAEANASGHLDHLYATFED
jgi:hypothetical protein